MSFINNVYNNSKEILSNLYQMVPQTSKPVQVTTPKMDPAVLIAKLGSSPWIKVAAISGAIAVSISFEQTNSIRSLFGKMLWRFFQ